MAKFKPFLITIVIVVAVIAVTSRVPKIRTMIYGA